MLKILNLTLILTCSFYIGARIAIWRNNRDEKQKPKYYYLSGTGGNGITWSSIIHLEPNTELDIAYILANKPFEKAVLYYVQELTETQYQNLDSLYDTQNNKI